MRAGERGEHRKIVMPAEPVAQALRLLDPDVAEPRPQRLHQLHLITVNDHPLAQPVQFLDLGRGPVTGDRQLRAPVTIGQALGEVREGELVELPALDRIGA